MMDKEIRNQAGPAREPTIPVFRSTIRVYSCPDRRDFGPGPEWAFRACQKKLLHIKRNHIAFPTKRMECQRLPRQSRTLERLSSVRCLLGRLHPRNVRHVCALAL